MKIQIVGAQPQNVKLPKRGVPLSIKSLNDDNNPKNALDGRGYKLENGIIVLFVNSYEMHVESGVLQELQIVVRVITDADENIKGVKADFSFIRFGS